MSQPAISDVLMHQFLFEKECAESDAEHIAALNRILDEWAPRFEQALLDVIAYGEARIAP